jgi:hypothetical protein
MRKLLVVLFCLTVTAAQAEKYCNHPPIGLFGNEGDTKSITWEMTVQSARIGTDQTGCSKDYLFQNGLNQPIEIMIKPKFVQAKIDNDNVIVIVPEKVGTDTMTVKILYNKRKGRVQTGYVNYTIKVKDKAL